MTTAEAGSRQSHGHDHPEDCEHAGHDHAHGEDCGHDHGYGHPEGCGHAGHDHAHGEDCGHDHGYGHPEDCGHAGNDHAHGEDCGHDHHDHGHDDHGHHHGHDHGHHHHDLRETSRRVLVGALIMTATFMVVEVIGGFLSGSLALVADAGHMLTDSASIGLALFAIWLAKRPASAERTYGYNRAEILAAAANALSLWLIGAWIIWEAIHRFISPEEIEGGTVLIVGGIGLLVNVVAAYMLHGASGHSLNVEGALQHVLADPEHAGDYDDMLRELRRIANDEHGIAHSTIQLETSVRGCNSEDHHVDHLLERQAARKKRRFAFGHHH